MPEYEMEFDKLASKLISILDTFERRFTHIENLSDLIINNTAHLRADVSQLLVKFDVRSTVKTRDVIDSSASTEFSRSEAKTFTNPDASVSFCPQETGRRQLNGSELETFNAANGNGQIHSTNNSAHCHSSDSAYETTSLCDNVGSQQFRLTFDAILKEMKSSADAAPHFDDVTDAEIKLISEDLVSNNRSERNHEITNLTDVTSESKKVIPNFVHSDLRSNDSASVACSSEESRESSIEWVRPDISEHMLSRKNPSLRRRRLNSLLDQQRSRVSWTKYLKQNVMGGRDGWEDCSVWRQLQHFPCNFVSTDFVQLGRK